MRPVKIIDRELKEFSGFFSKPQFSHFREYVIGLYTSYGRKTVANINENTDNGTDQSQLNRFLTNPKWNVKGVQEKYEEVRRYLNQIFQQPRLPQKESINNLAHYSSFRVLL